MTSPAKSRSRSIAGVDPRMGTVVNDNTPPAFPGHELSDLDGVPRQPAAEAVVHYGRLTQIASFPMHPDATAEAGKTVPLMDVLPERTKAKRPAGKKGATLAGLGSFLFHAVVVAALIMVVNPSPDPDIAMEESGDTLSVVMLGDSDADQLAAGEKSEQLPPRPDEVVAETLQPDVLQPTTSDTAEATPAEPIPSETPPVDTSLPVQPSEVLPEPVQPDQVQPTQSVTQVSPETVVSPEPEMLAAQAPAEPGEPAVAQPMATEVQPEEMKPAEAPPTAAVPTATEPETIQPTETPEVTPPAEAATPIERPKPPVKSVQKPKDVIKKPPPKAAKVKSGSAGEGAQDSTRGSSEGTETAQSDKNSITDGHRSGSGGAAEANYLGNVSSRLSRCIRRGLTSEYKRSGASGILRVTSNANGNVVAASMARGTGVPGLDGAIIGAARGCDLPSLPSEWGRPTRVLSQPVEVTQ